MIVCGDASRAGTVTSVALPPPGNDRAAIVTGASSGIGGEFARILSGLGYQVVLVARSADRFEELAGRLGPQAHPLPADLSDRTARAGLPERLAALGLVPDILINNAGLSTLGLVANSIPEQELNLVEVDVAAVVDLCSRFLPGMVDRHRGAVLNVASMAGFGPLPGQAAYGAARRSCCPTRTACAVSCEALASPRPRCVQGQWIPDSARRPGSPRRKPKIACRESCGFPLTKWPGPESTVWQPVRPSWSLGGSTGSLRPSSGSTPPELLLPLLRNHPP